MIGGFPLWPQGSAAVDVEGGTPAVPGLGIRTWGTPNRAFLGPL
jgi:hypothetical protein